MYPPGALCTRNLSQSLKSITTLWNANTDEYRTIKKLAWIFIQGTFIPILVQFGWTGTEKSWTKECPVLEIFPSPIKSIETQLKENADDFWKKIKTNRPGNSYKEYAYQIWWKSNAYEPRNLVPKNVIIIIRGHTWYVIIPHCRQS